MRYLRDDSAAANAQATRVARWPGSFVLAVVAAVVVLIGLSAIATAAIAGGIPNPPATYYGSVSGGADFTPTAGMPVIARIDGKQCGQSQTQEVNGQIVYVVDVLADDAGAAAGCGVPGRRVTFQVGTRLMAPSALWDNGELHQLNLHLGGTIAYLPLVVR